MLVVLALMLSGTSLCHSYDIKIALIAPVNDPHYNQYIGFGTSAGAVGLALDRIQQDQLLPNANISFIWSDQPCAEYQAAEVIFDVFRNQKVNVLLGPGCTQTAIIAGIIGANANTPLMSWSVTNPELEDMSRFPTYGLVLHTGAKIGYSIKAILDRFGWLNIGIFTNDDGDWRKCYFAKQGFMASISGTTAGLATAYETQYPGEIPTFEYANFWALATLDTRIIFVCLDTQADRRRFMQYSYSYGYTNNEFVYIMPQFIADLNNAEPWVDYSDTPDGLDDITKIAYEKVLIVDVDNDANLLKKFRSDIITRVKEPPLNYMLGPNDTVGSAYSPFLYDATILYAIALNKTLRQGGVVTNGSQIFSNMRNTTFKGILGNVTMDAIGERSPTYTIKGFDGTHTYKAFATIAFNRSTGLPVVQMSVTEADMWALWGGATVPDTPACGFDGSICRQKTLMVNALVGAVGSIGGLALIIGTIYKIYRVANDKKFCRDIWRIDKDSFKDLRMASGMSSSFGSRNLGSKSTLGSVSSDQKLKTMVLPDNCSLVSYNGDLTWCRKFEIRGLIIQHSPDHVEWVKMRKLTHDNINTFLGICVDYPNEIVVAWKFCPKFSLQEIFNHEHIKLDWFFKFSIMRDIVDGLLFLHESPLKSHGHLKSSNVLMDGRWMIKLTDYGLTKLRAHGHVPELMDMLWTAPELLRMKADIKPPLGTQKGDIYSLGIIMQELITETKPFESAMRTEEPPNYEKIIHNIRAGSIPAIRPRIDLSMCGDVDSRIIGVAEECWAEDPKWRPDIKTLKGTLKKLQKGHNKSMMDHVMDIMEKYAETLENTVKERTNQLAEEKKRCDLLLYRMLPQTIAEKLKSGQQLDPEQYESATVFFSDVVGFTVLSGKSTPIQVVSMLNQLYTLFDDTIAAFDVYKVETIGDAYLCVSGVPRLNGDKHVKEIADMAITLCAKITKMKIPHLMEEDLQLRVGLCTGPVCAGVVGLAMPHYCLFGDTVNTASRMESHGSPGKIQMTESTERHLARLGYNTERRGEIEVKGKGPMTTYWLNGHS